MTGRVEGWPLLLADFIESRRRLPFEWGRNDCCSFAAEWVRLATGRDVYAKWRGRYTGRWGALRLILIAGSIVRIPSEVGLRPCPVRTIQRGDIAGVTTDLGIALGICTGGRIAAPGNLGLEFLKFNRVKYAWRV